MGEVDSGPGWRNSRARRGQEPPWKKEGSPGRGTKESPFEEMGGGPHLGVSPLERRLWVPVQEIPVSGVPSLERWKGVPSAGEGPCEERGCPLREQEGGPQNQKCPPREKGPGSGSGRVPMGGPGGSGAVPVAPSRAAQAGGIPQAGAQSGGSSGPGGTGGHPQNGGGAGAGAGGEERPSSAAMVKERPGGAGAGAGGGIAGPGDSAVRSL